MVKLSVPLVTPVEPGRYVAVPIVLEEQPGRKGPYIRMGFEIAHGPCEGQQLFTNRSWDLFKPLLIAVGAIQPEESRKTWDGDTDDLLFKPIIIDVDVIKGRDGYPDKLEPVKIFGYDEGLLIPSPPEPDTPMQVEHEDQIFTPDPPTPAPPMPVASGRPPATLRGR